MIRPGIYRHFKGQLYRVTSVARHSETDEPHVVYQTTYGDKTWWIRPLSMFDELITRDGKKLRRFTRIEDQSESIELIHLRSEAGKSSEFEKDFEEMSKLLVLQTGYLAHELRRMQGRGDRYLLTISWLTQSHQDEDSAASRFTSASDLANWHTFMDRYQAKPANAAHFGSPLLVSRVN